MPRYEEDVRAAERALSAWLENESPTARDVMRRRAEHDAKVARIARIMAPMVNEWAARVAEHLRGLREAVSDYCPGCGDRAMLKDGLCEDCRALNADK